MNRGILNIEVVGAEDTGKTKGSCQLNISKLWKRLSIVAKTYLSLERDRFQLAANQREGHDGLDTYQLIPKKPTTINQES